MFVTSALLSLAAAFLLLGLTSEAPPRGRPQPLRLWGLPRTLSGALLREPVVVGLMCVIGAGNSFVDIGLHTLAARLVPEELLARVFGVKASLSALAIAVGSFRHAARDQIGDGRLVLTLHSGEGFGEIALLHDTLRTTTVRARTAPRLFTLDRRHFLSAVTDYESSGREAEAWCWTGPARSTPRTEPRNLPACASQPTH